MSELLPKALVELLPQLLSLGIVCGSVILKAPQIVKIVRANSAEGVSLSMHVLESLAYAIGTSWGIHRELEFWDYGETVFISAQLVVLTLLIAYHQKRAMRGSVMIAAILAFGWCLSIGMIPKEVHEKLMSFQIIISLIARLPQIYMNYKRKSTGQLAFVSFFLALGGAIARVLTVSLNVPWLKGKAILLLQQSVTILLNGLILMQIFMYRNSKVVGQKKNDDKKKK